jgi:hypothetical protein
VGIFYSSRLSRNRSYLNTDTDTDKQTGSVFGSYSFIRILKYMIRDTVQMVQATVNTGSHYCTVVQGLI